MVPPPALEKETYVLMNLVSLASVMTSLYPSLPVVSLPTVVL